MVINKDDMQNLFNEWMKFREEAIATMNEEDKKHLPGFEEGIILILKNIYPNRRIAAKKKLESMYDDIMNYSDYWNKKHYTSGFGDAMKLIISTLNSNP